MDQACSLSLYFPALHFPSISGSSYRWPLRETVHLRATLSSLMLCPLQKVRAVIAGQMAASLCCAFINNWSHSYRHGWKNGKIAFSWDSSHCVDILPVWEKSKTQSIVQYFHYHGAMNLKERDGNIGGYIGARLWFSSPRTPLRGVLVLCYIPSVLYEMWHKNILVSIHRCCWSRESLSGEGRHITSGHLCIINDLLPV